MKEFMLIIKSHCEAPDYENYVEAETREEAIDLFYEILRGEYDKTFIDNNMDEGIEVPFEHAGEHEPFEN